MLFVLEDISVEFNIGSKVVKVLEDFNLSIDKGEFIALIGPSGSGKTTVLNLMAGFQRPTRGRVLYRGEDLFSLTRTSIAAFRNKEIGMVHQFYNLLPDLTALQNVMVPLLIGGMGIQEARRRAQNTLEAVGVILRASHYPSEMSGGEQQRVAIARALANTPEVILADEPTGNLDYATTQEIADLLKELNKQGITIVVVTHDPKVAERATRVVDLSTHLKVHS
jgi:putative ABC transport system ATP-binding protein